MIKRIPRKLKKSLKKSNISYKVFIDDLNSRAKVNRVLDFIYTDRYNNITEAIRKEISP